MTSLPPPRRGLFIATAPGTAPGTENTMQNDPASRSDRTRTAGTLLCRSAGGLLVGVAFGASRAAHTPLVGDAGSLLFSEPPHNTFRRSPGESSPRPPFSPPRRLPSWRGLVVGRRLVARVILSVVALPVFLGGLIFPRLDERVADRGAFAGGWVFRSCSVSLLVQKL